MEQNEWLTTKALAERWHLKTLDGVRKKARKYNIREKSNGKSLWWRADVEKVDTTGSPISQDDSKVAGDVSAETAPFLARKAAAEAEAEALEAEANLAIARKERARPEVLDKLEAELEEREAEAEKQTERAIELVEKVNEAKDANAQEKQELKVWASALEQQEKELSDKWQEAEDGVAQAEKEALEIIAQANKEASKTRTDAEHYLDDARNATETFLKGVSASIFSGSEGGFKFQRDRARRIDSSVVKALLAYARIVKKDNRQYASTIEELEESFSDLMLWLDGVLTKSYEIQEGYLTEVEQAMAAARAGLGKGNGSKGDALLGVAQ